MVHAAVATDDIQRDISWQVRMGCFCSLRFRVSVIRSIFSGSSSGNSSDSKSSSSGSRVNPSFHDRVSVIRIIIIG